MLTKPISSLLLQTWLLEAMSRSTDTVTIFSHVTNTPRNTWINTPTEMIIFLLKTEHYNKLKLITNMLNPSKIVAKLNLPTLNATRKGYVIDILNKFDEEHTNNPGKNMTLDLYLRYYFLQYKKTLEKEDREAIVDYVYYLMMYKGYLNAICTKPMTWESRLGAFRSDSFSQ